MDNNNIFLTDPVTPLTLGKNRMQIGTFSSTFPIDSKFTSSNNLPTTGPVKIIGITGATTTQLLAVLPLSSHPLYINNIGNSMRIGVLALGIETPASSSSAQYGIGLSAFGFSSSDGAYGTLSKAFSTNPNGNSYGIIANASGQGNLTGVWGIAGAGTTGTGTRIGVRGFAVGGTTNFAGFFDGDVFINSPTFGGFIVAPSDQQFKTNINAITNANGIINLFQPKEFYFDTASFPQIHFSGNKQYGLIAQEVELILPELVTNQVFPAQYDSLGNQTSPDVAYKALNYNAFIAILMKGMQEQQLVIDSLSLVTNEQDSINEDLENRLTEIENCLGNTGICNNPNGGSGNRTSNLNVELENLNAIILDQNLPNPFKEKTTINYSIPEEVMEATLLFYDLNGRIIKQVEITERGEGTLTVYGENLKNGIYTYSLIADGKLIATKKMVKQ